MGVLYHSTRNSEAVATASEAILKGLSAEGGLFVPDHIPALDKTLAELSKMSYPLPLLYTLLQEFRADRFSDLRDNLRAYCDRYG